MSPHETAKNAEGKKSGDKMNRDEIKRQQAKTAEGRFKGVMEQAFKYAPKIAPAILAEAQDCLIGMAEGLKPGQIRVIWLKREARHGQAIARHGTTEVTWTVDAGREDVTVLPK